MAKKQSAEAPASAFDPQTLADIKEWQELAQWMATAKPRELELREKLAKHFFANPEEGVNRLEGNGYEIALDYKINRTIDEASLEETIKQLPQDFQYDGVLITYKPALCLKGFRLLEAQPQLLKTFQQTLIEKPGAPALHINIVDAGFDPSGAPASPDWPAKNLPKPPIKLPIMDAYEEAKAERKASKVHRSAAAFANAIVESKLNQKSPAQKPKKKK